MKTLSRVAWLVLALALSGALQCGAPQPSQPSTRGALDVEGGDAADAAEKPKAKSRQAQPAAPSEIVSLSLKGIPVLKRAGEAEAPASADPLPGTIGPPLPPKAESDASSGAEAAPDKGASPDKQDGPDKGSAPDQAAAPASTLPPRNLFAFEEDPAVVLERQRKAEEAAQRAAEAAQRAAEERQKQEEYLRAHPPPPQPPSITFQFIGYMGPPEARIGVFTTPSILLARKGDMILGKYKVVSIGYESAEIGFTGFTQTQRIPLSAGGK